MIRVEMRKQAFRLRTYVALGLMAALPVVMTLALKFGHRNDPDRDFFALASHSGINMPLAALAAGTSFLLVVIVSLFAGGAVSEEANWGSLRYLLVRPVSRSRVLSSKLVVAAIMGAVATLLIVISALIAGTIAFGWHPVFTPQGGAFSQGSAAVRLALATVYVSWCMSGIIALAFMISTVSNASTGAVMGAVGVAVVSQILDAISTLGSIRTLFITHYWHAWETLFASPVETSQMVKGVLLQIPYVVVFLLFAWWWFHRRDILT